MFDSAVALAIAAEAALAEHLTTHGLVVEGDETLAELEEAHEHLHGTHFLARSK